MRLFLFLFLLPFGLKAQNQVDAVISKVDTVTEVIYATYYAKKFNGRRTTSGEIYRPNKFTAAHRSLPFGSIIRVKNLRNNKTVKVRVNDRGPFSKKFDLDLSKAAAKALGIYRLGYARVKISYLSPK